MVEDIEVGFFVAVFMIVIAFAIHKYLKMQGQIL